MSEWTFVLRVGLEPELSPLTMANIHLGKSYKTGRTVNNGPVNAGGLQPTGAPPSTSHSAPMTPAETRCVPSHSAGAMSIRQQPFVPKTPAPSKLRRELTQPTLNRLELYSSSPEEKQLTNDFSPFQLRSNIKLQSPQRSVETRAKRSRINSTRLTVDHLPNRPVTRSILIDRPPSPKGKQQPHPPICPRSNAKQISFVRNSSLHSLPFPIKIR